MRIATYNVEWFTNLFDKHDRLIEDDGLSGRQDVTRADQAAALGIVFSAMDADAVMIVEAPDTSRSQHRSTVKALENFAARYELRTSRALLGFANGTQQEIALLYDPAAMTATHDPMGDPTGKHGAWDAPRFDGTFRLDLDIDARSDVVSFSKPPLEARCETAGGAVLRLIGVHVKSKAPHGAETPEEIMRLAIENRRKQLAQCIWLRQRVEGHLEAGENLIVLGDFNDGPGLDEYEKLFGRSGVEIVMGEDGRSRLYDPHARMALSQRVGAMPVTARFYIASEERYLQALLDYVMVSPSLRGKARGWRIWHPFDDPVCYRTPELREALLTASDHFPVTVDLNL